MRPVRKGDWPTDDAGDEIEFTQYKYAKRYLFERIGQYCSYCEQHIPALGAVEHVQPKSLNPALEFDWDNFLLGCVNCNSAKLNKPIVLNNYFWPDRHNTFKCYQYDNTGIVKPATGLSAAEKLKAERMIELVGLDKISPKVGTRKYEEASDLRWENRIAAWLNAEDSLKSYESAPDVAKPYIVPEIAKVAASGFWSVWMTVFQKHREVRLALLQVPVGTNPNSFDANGNPV